MKKSNVLTIMAIAILSFAASSVVAKEGQITVKNTTPTDLYIAVYEEFSGKNAQKPKRYGQVLQIKGQNTTFIGRPQWTLSQRWSGNRNLYFGEKKDELENGILGDNFVNIGEHEGDIFVIYPADRDGKPSRVGIFFKAAAEKAYNKDIVPQY